MLTTLFLKASLVWNKGWRRARKLIKCYFFRKHSIQRYIQPLKTFPKSKRHSNLNDNGPNSDINSKSNEFPNPKVFSKALVNIPKYPTGILKPYSQFNLGRINKETFFAELKALSMSRFLLRFENSKFFHII